MQKTYSILREFSARVLKNDSEQEFYIRIRSGPNRRQAKKIASGIDVEGDASSLARSLYGRVQGAGGDPVWVELLESGQTEILDSAYLPSIDPEGEIVEFSQGDNANHLMAKVVADMAAAADMRAQESQDRLLGMMRAVLDLNRQICQQDAELMIERAQTDDNQFSDALQMMAPLMPAIAAKLSGPHPKAKNGPSQAPTDQSQPTTPEGPEEFADDLLGALESLVSTHPEVITPDRIARIIGAVRPSTPAPAPTKKSKPRSSPTPRKRNKAAPLDPKD